MANRRREYVNIIRKGTAEDRRVLRQQKKEFNRRQRNKAASHTLGSAYPQAWAKVKEVLGFK